MDGVIVYTLEFCPNCELLKGYLKERAVPYAEEDMSTAEALTELRINGVFASEAPVLRVGETFLVSEDLFAGGKVRTETVDPLLAGE